MTETPAADGAPKPEFEGFGAIVRDSLARLARLLMHEEFRARLEAAETAAALIQLLANQAGFKEPED